MLNKARIIFGLLAGLIIFLGFALAINVQAQTAEQEWTTPVNLSQSGAASDPITVSSSDERLHILWEDSFNGFVYSQGDGDTFSEPVAAPFPFGREVILLNGGSTRTSYPPKLIADNNNRIHAFWTDNEDGLFYSRVLAEEFAAFASWTAQQQLAEVALAFDIALGSDDLLHLAYIRPISSADFPAGVYYRNSTDGGAVWSSPVLLYQSPYFRGLSSQTARVQIQATVSGEVVLAWDNQPEDRVFIIRSGDNGATWEEPTEIDGRQNDDLDTAVGPSKISVVDDGSAIHLFWQAGHEALLCAQYHQWSVDGGLTWQPVRRVLAEFEGCSQDNGYVVVPGGLVLATIFESGVYTQFWNGSQWGSLERHSVLSGFSNPSTFRLVDLGCRNFNVQNGRVLVIGCDASTNNDIWQLSTSLENLTQAEADNNSVWSDQSLVSSLGEGEGLASPQLVADADGRIHGFWSQSTDTDSLIYYIVSEGAGWTAPIDILTSPGNNSLSENLSVAFHPDGQLMAVWDNGPLGEIYFSHVLASLASSAVEWFTPIPLPALNATAGSPDIAFDANGRIYVAYALQLNEDRGIYVVSSDDEGESWSDPNLVFDGVLADWDAVDEPHLTVTGDGVVHVIWSQKTFPPSTRTINTAYAASSDGGESWSEEADLPFADVQPVWSDISAAGLQTVYRIWQEDFQNSSNYWSQISNDSGLTWEQPLRISDRNNLIGQAALIADGGGTPHLVQLTGVSLNGPSNDGASPMIQHWTWVEGSWSEAEGFATEAGQINDVEGVAGAVAANGNLVLMYSGLNLNLETGRFQPGYLTSRRSLSVVLAPPTPVPTVTINGTVTISETTGVTPTPTPVIVPTPTVFFPQEQGGSGIPIPLIGSVDPLVAIIPIGFVVLMIVLASVRIVRNAQD